MSIAYSGDNITFPDSTVQNTAPKTGMVNKIINGDMRIDQRNAGASISIPDGGTTTYPVDRFGMFDNTSGALDAQQDSVAPAGFVNSLKVTTTTADTSVTSSEQCWIRQRIEGFNVSDLAWGSANAKEVTLSFWVRSSLTGTFGGSVANSVTDRSYPFTYSITIADTWEKKSVTILGDTSGTWLTTNGVGLQIFWSLGVGTDFQATAGVWTGSNKRTATGETQVISTNGATFYITGVQLEKGSTATDFDYRPYELALCQRYYQKSYPQATVPGTSIVHTSGGCQNFWWAASASSTIGGGGTALPVAMRTQPTVVIYDMAGTSGVVSGHSSGGTLTNGVALNQTYATENNVFARVYNVSYVGISYAYTLTAEL